MAHNSHALAVRNIARLAALQDTGLLDSPDEEAFDRLVRIAARLLEAPVSVVSLVDTDRQFFKSQFGVGEPWTSERGTPLAYSFCQYALASSEPLVIPDSQEHPLVCENLATLELGIRAYAGIPLVNSDGYALGTLCVADTVPRQWTTEQIRLLQDLAAAVMTQIELRKDNEERRRAETELRRMSEDIRLLQEISTAANEALTVSQAVQKCLDRVCDYMGWPVGHAYFVGPEGNLVSGRIWHLDEPERLGVFRRLTEHRPSTRNEGLPGRVLATAAPVWISDLAEEASFPRAMIARSVGLRGGFAFPVLVGAEVAAVLEFFSESVEEPDPRILETMRHVGVQLGRVIERSRAEEAARHNEERTRLIVESAHDAYVAMDEIGIITDWNVQAEHTFGWTRAEAVGQPLAQLIIPPEYREKHLGGVQHFLRTGEAPVLNRRVQVPAMHRDGHLFPVEMTVTPIWAGDSWILSSFLHDITERKNAEEALRQSEERYRGLVETASDIICEADARGTITYANSMTVRLLGYSLEELIGTRYEALVREDSREAMRAFYAQQFHGQVLSTYYEFPAITKAGDEVWLGQNVQLLVNEGRVVGVQVVARNITGKREVERMKDEFVSLVSHELRTPLTSIRGSLGLLASGKLGSLDQNGQRMLEIAEQNSDRLVRLINDILDIERIEAGKIAMEKETISAADLARQAVDVMRPMADRAGVVLQLTASEESLWADPDRIIQVLTNLLSNAIKFSPSETLVAVKVERQDENVLFSVRDHGRGIPPAKLELIFERFQQVDSSDARLRGGTGLGLSICKSIVQQHGGRIWSESVPGEGSTFFFTLPAPQPREADLEARPNGPTILVCENDSGVCSLIRTLLEKNGYQTATVCSGREAVEYAVAQRPAVILLDPMVSEADDRHVLTMLKEKPETRDIPVVVLGMLERRADDDVDPSLVSGWLAKPLDFFALLRAVEVAAGKPQWDTCNVLLVEDDVHLAQTLTETFRRHGVTVRHARSGQEATALSRIIQPDLLVLDIGLPDSDGFAVVEWFRRQHRLSALPMVVYTARDLDTRARERLRLGPTQFMTKSRIQPEEFERRVMALLTRILPTHSQASLVPA